MLNIKIILNELEDLEFSIQEWLQTLEQNGKRNSKLIWSNFSTRRIIKLTEKLLENIEINLNLIKEKHEDKNFFKTARVKYQQNLEEIKRSLSYD